MKWHLNKPAFVLLNWLLRSALLLVLSAVTSSACAQQQLPVRMRIEPISIRGRSGGPILLQIKLEYNQPQITEGDLLLRIYNSVKSDTDLMATIRHEGIVLQSSDYIFNTVLPPIEHSANKQYQITGWFETDSERIPLTSDPKRADPPEPHQLMSIAAHERAALIASFSGRTDYQTPSANRGYLNRALGLTNYLPGPDAAARVGRGGMFRTVADRMQSFTVDLDALSLPEDPLQLCTFDVILLADGALGRLKQTQLSALSTWIQAGGSLCVLPDSNRLTKTHLLFLQTHFESESSVEPRLTLAKDNTLQVTSSSHTAIVHCKSGLGRVSLLPVVDSLQKRLHSRELGQLVSHLWKVRNDSNVQNGQPWDYADIFEQLSHMGLPVTHADKSYIVPDVQNGGDDLPYCANAYHRIKYESVDALKGSLGRPIQLPPEQNLILTTCQSMLAPDDIEIVPTSVIGLLLLGYIITIGPLDYIVLGLFKARKYTWILFPITTAGFTILTLAVAHQYMATSHTGATLSITDIINDGHPVRQTDIQLRFSGAHKTATQEYASAFTVPAQPHAANNYLAATSIGATQDTMSGYQSLSYSGRFPQQYVAAQNIRQWEPRTTRTMSLSPDSAGIPDLPWNDADLATTPDGRDRLRSLLKQRQQKGEFVDAIVIRGRETFFVFPDGGFLFEPHLKNWWKYASRTKHDSNWHPRLEGPALAATGILAASVDLSDTSFFSVVAQVSPSGSATFEDLPVMDATDPNQTLLIVVEKKDDNFHVFRKLYHSKDSISVRPLPAELAP